MRLIILLVIAISVGGCSSMFAAISGRPVQADHFQSGGPDGSETVVMSLTGERRVAVVNRDDSRLRVCAESMPDAAMAIGGRTSADVTFPSRSGTRTLSADDQYQQALVQTFLRTETSDVVRQLGWQLCQAWASGAITSARYSELLGNLVAGSVDVLRTRAHAAPAMAGISVSPPLTPRSRQ